MIYLVFFVLFLTLFYWYITSSFKYWESRGVLFEKPLPVFGNMLKVVLQKESVGNILAELYRKFNGPYFGVYMFGTPYLILKSPDIIKQVLIRDFNSFPNRSIYTNEKIDPLAANVLVAMKNPHWKALRTKLSPVFTSGKMKLMMPLMEEVALNLKRHLNNLNADGEEVDVREIMKRYSIDIISSCAFGINSNCIKNKDSSMNKMARQLFDPTSFVRAFSVFSYAFNPTFVKLFRLTFLDKEASDYLTKVFTESYQERRERKIKRNDLIDLLHYIKETENESDEYKFDAAKMSAQAMIFFNAGNETTASTLSFGLYELSLNPDVQSKLREEIKTTITKNGSISYEALHEMPYLDKVVQETLRKYPLAMILNRQANESFTFESTGLQIDKGTSIMVPVTALHYDPQYFPNPDAFDPERFTEEKRKEVQYVFLPFGDGPRKCIGERFALMSVKIALTTIIKDFEVTATENTEVPIKFNKMVILLQPKNGVIFLKLKKI